MNVTQQYDAPPATVFELFKDADFVAGRLADSGAPDATVVSLEPSPDGVRIVTRQSIPASVLPSMVASMMQGDPVTERTEDWRADGAGYLADFSLVVKGAPAAIKGTMTLSPAGSGSTLVINGQATVPIPMFGGKIESVIAEQIGTLLGHEEAYTRSQLPA